MYTYNGANNDSNAISSHSKTLCYMAPGTALSVFHTQSYLTLTTAHCHLAWGGGAEATGSEQLA